MIKAHAEIVRDNIPKSTLLSVYNGYLHIETEEENAVQAFLNRTLPQAHVNDMYFQGRNAYLPRDPGVYMLRGPLSYLEPYLQISGGCYQPFEIVENGVARLSNQILPPSATNFVPGRESMHATAYIDERTGKIAFDKKEYAPTGAYTYAQAERKAAKTMEMYDRLHTKNIDRRGECRVIIPRVVDMIKYPELHDPNGKPLYGIIMLVQDPHKLVDQAFIQSLNRFPDSATASKDLTEFYRQVSLQIQPLYRNLGIVAEALKNIHNFAGVTHGQPVLGNLGTLSYVGRSVFPDTAFFKDWDTMCPLPRIRSKDDFAKYWKARALDLYAMIISATKTIDILFPRFAFDMGVYLTLQRAITIGIVNSVVQSYTGSADEVDFDSLFNSNTDLETKINEFGVYLESCMNRTS